MAPSATAQAFPIGRCRLCGSQRLRPWKTGGVRDRLAPEDLRISDARYGLTLPLVRCEDCGFRFAEGGEVARLTDLYSELEDPGYEGSQESRALQMRWLVDVACRAHPRAATAIDIGAASGLLTAEARRRGLDAIGVEPSRPLGVIARETHGIELLQGVLPRPELAGRRFDLVFVVDVIEHVADPLKLMADAVDLLADGGFLLLVTPDVSSLAARVLGWRWWHYRLAHVGYFERSTLERVFAQAGLEPRRWLRAKWFFSIGYLAARLEAYAPVAGINRLASRSRALARLYEVVLPLNLFDSYAVLAQRASGRP